MVKPEQVLFGACIDGIKLFPQRREVLAYCITACRTAVESQSDAVCPVIVRRSPIHSSRVELGAWAVKEIYLHDVM